MNTEKNTRVRFAPSPTGYLHVGGARTAIFNWLYARNTRGVFVVRVEDTDAERSTRESEESLIADLRWLGLDWDEGPDKGGENGPYRQSDRIEMYRTTALSFVREGLAYPCFCTDDELARKKEAAVKTGKPLQYDGTCRRLGQGEIEEKRRAGVPETIRFEVPEGAVVFKDLVRGGVTLDTGMVGDFVILRSNGLPTYNFAAAHDDHHMGITHVIRGEEHLPNTLRQVLIYRALGAEPPQFGHVPLILAEDKSKLSKRHGASSVGELRRRGFLPEAVVNYLLLLGWSHPDEKEKLSRDEMIGSFSTNRIGKAAAVFDPKKLCWMNGLYIRELELDDWISVAEPYLPASIVSLYGAPARRDILELLQAHVDTADQLPEQTGVFEKTVIPTDEAAGVLGQPSSRDVLSALAETIRSMEGEWTPENIKASIKRAGKTSGKKGKELFFPVRAALTGSVHGPDLSRIAAIKGKDTVLTLIDKAIG